MDESVTTRFKFDLKALEALTMKARRPTKLSAAMRAGAAQTRPCRCAFVDGSGGMCAVAAALLGAGVVKTVYHFDRDWQGLFLRTWPDAPIERICTLNNAGVPRENIADLMEALGH